MKNLPLFTPLSLQIPIHPVPIPAGMFPLRLRFLLLPAGRTFLPFPVRITFRLFPVRITFRLFPARLPKEHSVAQIQNVSEENKNAQSVAVTEYCIQKPSTALILVPEVFLMR